MKKILVTILLGAAVIACKSEQDKRIDYLHLKEACK